MKKFFAHIMAFLFFSVAEAQEKETVSLPDTSATVIDGVDIIRYKTGKGIKNVALDTLLMQAYKGRTLADILQGSGLAYIRQYAPGQIASISMRGSNANQVQVIWNGFNLNNLSLGQTDFSLVPMSLFSGIQVNLGAMGATGGNGVMAGSVELQNQNNLLEKQTACGAGFQAGSFGRYSASATGAYKSERFSFSIQPFYSNNRNQYTFVNPEGDRDTVEHAAAEMMGLMLGGNAALKNSVISASAWLQQAHREVPATLFEARSYATQDDRSLRFALNQKVKGQGFFRNNRLGYFFDGLDYLNTLYVTGSSGFKVHNVQGETESFWKHKNSEHRVKLFASGATAVNTNYQDTKDLLRASLGYFFETSLQRKRQWDFSAAIKEEINNGFLSIPIAQLGINTHWTFNDKYHTWILTGRLNLGTVYRFPTLNDLYWYPGGNPNLKPEKGGSGNVSVALDMIPGERKKGNYLRMDFTHYQRYIYDWITWQPNGANWSPQNLQEVWSRGNETSLSFQAGYRVKWFSRNVFNYTLSTIMKNHLINDRSVGRQLIYTPIYNTVTEWGIRYRGISLSGNLSYYGYRYTSSDNYEYLEPFYLLGARLVCTKKIRSGTWDVFVDAANLLDQTYYWVAQRPALPRNFNFGFSFKWMSRPKTINSTINK